MQGISQCNIFILQSTLVIAKVPLFDVMMYNKLLSKTLNNCVLDLIFTVLLLFLSCMIGSRKISSLTADNELIRTLLDTVLQFIPWDVQYMLEKCDQTGLHTPII